MIKIITAIVKGFIKVLKFIAVIFAILLISYALSYISDLNTRQIFLRLSSIVSVLTVLHSLGKK